MRMLKEAVYRLLVLSGASWVDRRLNRRKSLVLLYHGVDADTVSPVLNFGGQHVRMQRFERQMRYLAAHYCVVPLDQLLNGTRGVDAGKPLAAVTFDDGYRNLYFFAYPVLKRLALPATVFVITDSLQSGRPRWWDRMSAMVASTQSSTVRVPVQGKEHWFRLGTLAEKQAALRVLARELQGLPPPQREALLARLAVDLGVKEPMLPTSPPLTVSQLREMAAYPYGDFSTDVAAAAREAGYRGALTTIERLNDGIPDPWAVRRMGVDDTMTLACFIVATSGLRDVLKALLRVCRSWRLPFLELVSDWSKRRRAAYVRDRGQV